MLFCFVQNRIAGNHHTKIDDLVIVASKNNADDIFTNIVNVTLNRRHQHFASERLRLQASQFFLFFHERQQMSDCFLHHASRLHDLRQKHFAATEQVTYDRHPVHHWPFNDVQAAIVFLTCLFGVVDDVFVDAFDQCVREAFFDGSFTPCQIFSLSFFTFAFDGL